MARDWSELFITDAPARDAEASASHAPGRGLFKRLRENLSKTREALGGEIQATLFGTLDAGAWERLEEALILADVGARTTASIVGTLKSEAQAGELRGGRGADRAIDRAAGTDRACGRRPHRRSRPTDRDHGGRGQWHR